LRPTDAKEVLARSIDQTAKAIAEGREALQELRTSRVGTDELTQAITILGEQLAADASRTSSVGFHVEAEDPSRTLRLVVRDEIFRIASEALSNAFRHAGAQRIEVELRFNEQRFRLRIRDDGNGIDAALLTAEGRVGHFGLLGMRERATLIGGKLTVRTATDSGTEIELIIPAARAYAGPPRRNWFSERFFRRSAQGR
jgi:signal transduction histidine kinase